MKSKLEELTLDELKKELNDAKEKIRISRFKAVTGNLQNTKEIRDNKKKIARIHTLKKEYEIGLRVKK
ncbi:MAG: 50S ribosomal protein L29 [Spirochaetes bacterium]|nr:50S ribosomal protein L29 [Spirochaetota bacterium]